MNDISAPAMAQSPRNQTRVPIPKPAGFEGDLRAGIVAERDLGGAVEGAGAVGSDHHAHLAVDAARGAVRSQPFLAGGGGAVFGGRVEDRVALFVGQAAGGVGDRGRCGLGCRRRRGRLCGCGCRAEGRGGGENQSDREGSEARRHRVGHGALWSGKS